MPASTLALIRGTNDMGKDMVEMTPSEHRTEVLVSLQRIEGTMNRIDDRVKRNSDMAEALLDVVTGSKSGAKQGLVVRVIDLEDRIVRQERAILKNQEITGRMDTMEDKLDTVLRMQTDHPPLLYLLRFHTRKTVMWIVLIFVILSAFYVSSFRIPILEFFGLPIF